MYFNNPDVRLNIGQYLCDTLFDDLMSVTSGMRVLVLLHYM